MTLLADLIEIPTQVAKSDFVIRLVEGIANPDQILHDYVVAPQLVPCFDRAVGLVASAVIDQRSKGAYLHGSFGSGKTHFMAVLHLLLNGHPGARSIPELGSVVAQHSPSLAGKKFLMVPFHFVGAASVEERLFTDYVRHVRELHPDAPPPHLFVADGLVAEAQRRREQLGDELFFSILSEGSQDEAWGTMGAAWDAARFGAAVAAGAGSNEHDALVGQLLATHFSVLVDTAIATGHGFVSLDDGLAEITRHAKSLGYDAVVLFLDELILWLATLMPNLERASLEGAKLAKLVEAGQPRAVPIVSFIARQRDLRDFVGEAVSGAASLNFADVLRHWEGRFDTITLEDRNLPAIAQRRLLQPRSDAARQQLDDVFDGVRRQIGERHETDVLLTDSSTIESFRQLYPFSPALVDALVALSSVMQRERTALKVMLQLLVDHREHLRPGDLVPLGDLFDAINAGDEPLTDVMRDQFSHARRMWNTKLAPLLMQEHGFTDVAQTEALDPSHEFVADARVLKSLLVAALVPEAPVLRNLTVGRLSALNAGVVRAFLPGGERQKLLTKLRGWSLAVGELHVGDDPNDPTVSLALSGVDVTAILDAVAHIDNDGGRARKLRDLLVEELKVRDDDTLDPYIQFEWRGTRRTASVLFGNVRDEYEMPDESFRAGDRPKVVIDLPFDPERAGPGDDRARAEALRLHRAPEWTVCWLPQFFTTTVLGHLGRLVRIDYLLSGDQFNRASQHLSPADRPVARQQLEIEQRRLYDGIRDAFRQAFGIDQAQPPIVTASLAPEDQYQSLDASIRVAPPVAANLRDALDKVAAALYDGRYPKHPLLADVVSTGDLRVVRDSVIAALGQEGGRLEVPDSAHRRILKRVVKPLDVGEMHEAHMVANLSGWITQIEQAAAREGASSMTVAKVRRWINGSGLEQRGMTTEMTDLVLVLFAAATNRALIDRGNPASADLGRLGNDWELVSQQLPDPDAWALALERAAKLGIMPTSRQLGAVAVADLNTKLHDRFGPTRTASLKSLGEQLTAAFDRFGIDRTSADRWQMHSAATSFVRALTDRADSGVSLLASSLPQNVAALGTAIEQADRVAAALSSTNWDLVSNAFALEGEWAGQASALRARWAEGLVNDELVVSLVSRLGEVVAGATDLLSRAAKVKQAPPQPPLSQLPPPQPLVVSDDPIVTPADTPPAVTHDRAAARVDAEARLRQLHDRLRPLGLELEWTLTELRDGDR